MSPHEEPLNEGQFSQPLAGLLVADFSRVLAGPLTTMTLADLGARVIKVEHPDTGDDTRSWGPPYSATGATDAPIAVACGNNSQFGKLCAVLGLEHLAEDPRFSSNALRVKHRSELESLLEDELKASTANEWQTRLSDAGVPVGQVLDIAGGIDFAETLGLEPTVDVVGDNGETVGRQLRHPLTWDPPLPRTASAPPALGQHSQEVLAWLRSSPSDDQAKPSQEQS